MGKRNNKKVMKNIKIAIVVIIIIFTIINMDALFNYFGVVDMTEFVQNVPAPDGLGSSGGGLI